MSSIFRPATRWRRPTKWAIEGPAKSGKTWTALAFATALRELNGGGRVALVDTEGRSSELYAGIFDFEILTLAPEECHPEVFRKILAAAIEEEILVLIFDSFSHTWIGEAGALELAELAATRYGGNTWAGWRDVRPLMRELFDDIIRAPIHVLATIRTVEDWVLQADPNTGKSRPVKVGLKPVVDKDAPFVFDVVGRMDMTHTIHFEEVRIPDLCDRSFRKPGREVVEVVWDWLNEGEAIDEEALVSVAKDWVKEVELKKSPAMVPVERTGPSAVDFWKEVRARGIDSAAAKEIWSAADSPQAAIDALKQEETEEVRDE